MHYDAFFILRKHTKINRRESRMHFKLKCKVPDLELNWGSKQDEELQFEFECKEVEIKWNSKINNLTHKK